MRIALIGSSLAAGGAERVLSTLANTWADRHDVALITIHSSESDFFALDPRVARIALGAGGDSSNGFTAIWSNLGRVRMLHAALRMHRADVAISFMTQINVLSLLATWGSRVPIIVSERTDREVHQEPLLWRVLQRITYGRAFAVVAQTRRGADYLRGTRTASRIEVIPNPVSEPDSSTDLGGCITGLPERFLVAMGRLAKEKGFDMLIRAFASMSERHDLCLVIIGAGGERDFLETLAHQSGVGEVVKFLGALHNPFPIIRRATGYVLSSRFEGFPNALAEAMACGVPGIAFDRAGGPAELIRNGIDGILVPQNDISAMAQTLDRLVGDEKMRNRMALHAREVVGRFSVSRVARVWEDLLLEAVRENPQTTDGG